MKKILLSAVFLLTISLGFAQIKGSELCSKKKLNQSHAFIKDNERTEPTTGFNVLNYDMDIDIFNCYLTPFSHLFNGVITIQMKALEPLTSIELNAVNTSLTINSIAGASASFTHATNKLTVVLDRTYAIDEVFSITVNYTHNNVDDGGFYASNGMVFTDCEPEGARFWYPCKDTPSDKATFDLTARVPVNVLLGSNGILADSTLNATDAYYHWVTTDQIPTYLVSIASKVDYNLDIVYWQNAQGQQIPMRFYYNTGENPSEMEALLPQLTTTFSSLFCEHPFPKNGFATLNNEFTWGGMENQTLTNLCPDCWGESLIVHEFAHQWFGDMITCATWADIWLNEGFATFSEALWMEQKPGGTNAAYKQDLANNASYYLGSNPGRPIYVPEWAVTTPNVNLLFDYSMTYMKSSCIPAMLRYVLGDETFFNFLHAYSNNPNFKYKSVTTLEFNTFLNEFTGVNYDWFFQSWVYQPSHPVYRNKYSVQDNGNGTWTVLFTTKQIQPGGTFFKIPMQVKIHFVDGSNVFEKVFNDVNNQEFSFTYSKQPANLPLTFDPYNEILLKSSQTVISSVDNLSNENNFITVSPNPANNIITVNCNSSLSGKIALEIYDITGKKVQILTIENKNQSFTKNFSIQNLEKGIYFVKFKIDDKQIQSVKIIKQ